jgi:hypothetical protein
MHFPDENDLVISEIVNLFDGILKCRGAEVLGEVGI